MRKLATIEQIKELRPHPNADTLELATVCDLQVVVKKNEFKENSLIVFIWPDTLIPVSNWNSFLEKTANSDGFIRIKSIRLRGELSTGLVVSPSYFFNSNEPLFVGKDVSDVVNAKPYVKDLNTGGVRFFKDEDILGDFPEYLLPKTDEILAQSVGNLLQEFDNEEVYLTLKIDGTSFTFIQFYNYQFICSRNYSVKYNPNTIFGKIVDKYNLLKKDFKNIAIQGEIYGPKIQKNPLNAAEIALAVFNVYDLNTKKLFGLDQLLTFCDQYQLPTVKILDRFIFNSKIHTLSYLQQYADNILYSVSPKVYGEGFVLRPINPKYNSVLGRFLSLKFINRNYKD